MAKRIFHLIDRLALLATQQGGYASKPELAKTLAIASQQAFNALLPAKGGRAVGPGLNRQLDTRLLPFLREAVYTPSSFNTPGGITDNRFSLPEPGYVSFYDAEGADVVEEVTGHAWALRRSDPIAGPTVERPIVRDLAGTTPNAPTKQILPVPERLLVVYYAYPTEPLYKENYDTGSPVYDDEASIDTGWGLEMEPELLARSLRLLGLEIRDPQLQAVAAQLTAETL